MTISLLVKKLIAGILALIMPITTATAVKQQTKTEAPKNDFHAAIRYDDPLPNIETEEDTIDYGAPEGEVKGAPETEDPENNETTDAQPTEGTPVENETNEIGMGESAQAKAKAYDYVAEWDVSATDEDDVHMYYYEEDDDKFIDAITATVKALFVPMTAYADELGEETEEEAEEADEETYAQGTVVLDGTGETDSMLFLNWLDMETFLPVYEEWCINNGFRKECYIDKNDIDADGNMTEPVLSINEVRDFIHEDYPDATDEDLYKIIAENYIPAALSSAIYGIENFWARYATFVPKHIIIKGDVTAVNFMAFAFCSEVEDIKILADIETIGAGAFAHTGITNIVIPATTTNINDEAFSGCANLKKIYIKGDIYNCGYDALGSVSESLDIYCQSYLTYYTITGEVIPVLMSELDDYFPVETSAVSTKTNRTTTVTFNPAEFVNL